MKVNKILCIALASVLMAGCTQDELSEGSVTVTGEDVLNVVVNDNGFGSAEGSRVVTEGYTTAFEEGDQLGVFVVDTTDSSVTVDNLCLTLDADGAWTGNTLYYYPNSDYIAYFPYDSSLSGVTGEDEIMTYFEENKLSNSQSTKATYEAADLMSATVSAADVVRGENITFALSHKMSMIELLVPVRTYKVSEDDGAWEYSAPLGLSLEVGGNEFTPYTYEKGTYRIIVAPGEETEISGSFQDGATPVYFPATGETYSITPTAGTYKQLDIQYSGISTDVEVRALAAGDYYYSDGSIWPNELDNVPTEGCIGVIYSTDVPASNQEYADGYTHGYVVALVNTQGETGDGGYINWASSTGSILIEGNVVGYIYDDEGTTEELVSEAESLLSKLDGYSVTSQLAELSVTAALEAQNFGTDDTAEYAAPEGTSGWFLPASGQLAEMLNAFSSDVVKDGAAWDFDSSNARTNSGDQAQKVEMMEAVRSVFAKVGGDFFNDDEISTDPGSATKGDILFTTVELDESNVWAIEWKTNGQVYFLSRGRTSDSRSVRAILAF